MVVAEEDILEWYDINITPTFPWEMNAVWMQFNAVFACIDDKGSILFVSYFNTLGKVLAVLALLILFGNHGIR